MTTRAEFLATVRTYIGTPYHHQGRSPGVGLDCPGPMICAAWAHGIKSRTFDVTSYPREPDGITLQAHCDEHLDRIDFADAEPGDVLLCKFQQGAPRHLGILSDANPLRRYWIEAEGFRHRRVIESRLVLGRFMQLVAAYRVPGLT
jgi:cell wall-associated NlpC family hydrolase